MFSANPSISPTGLKPSDVANGVGLGENGVRLGRERGQIGGGRGWTGGNAGRTGRNGVGLGEIGSDWAGTRVELAGNGVELVGWTGGSDWGIRGGANSFGPTLCLRCAQSTHLYVKCGRAGCTGQGEPFEGRNS